MYVVATGFNAGATHETGEPAPLPGSLGKSVWWSWKAPVTGTVAINLAGSDDTAMAVAVFAGSALTNLQLLADERNVAFEAVAGQRSKIRSATMLGTREPSS